MQIDILRKNTPFPDPRGAAPEGWLAVGGDLSTERLLSAYRQGIFPWYTEEQPIYWWCPDHRMVFDLGKHKPMKISKSLSRSIRNRGYRVTENHRFSEVIKACAEVPRKGEEGTWITNDMIQAYIRMNKEGHANCISVEKNGELVGGVYGVDLEGKKVFCGESMFTQSRDASKVALAYLTDLYKKRGYRYIDCQMHTDHLESLGAIKISRAAFLDYLNV